MKKLLTILALALALTLICCAGLAESYDDLDPAYQALVDPEIATLSGLLDGQTDDITKKYTWFGVNEAQYCDQAGSIEIHYNGPAKDDPEGHEITQWTKSVEIAAGAHIFVWPDTYRVDGQEVEATLYYGYMGLTDACKYDLRRTESCDVCGYSKTYDESIAHTPDAYMFVDNPDDAVLEAGGWATPEEETRAKHLGYYKVTMCSACGEELSARNYVKPVEAHSYDSSVRYILLGGEKVYEWDYPTYNENECTCEVYVEWFCGGCGQASKTEKLYGVRGHTYGTEDYTVYDAYGNPVGWFPGGIDEKATLCTMNKADTLVKNTRCATCNEIIKEVILGNGRGGHTYATGNANNAAHWARITVQPTCRTEGEAIDYCTFCGADGPHHYNLPKLDHQYTVKVYNCADSAKPTCKNGLTVKYALKCILCRDMWGLDYYEGGVLYPNYNHSEKLTPVELINLEWGHKNGTNTYEYTGASLLPAGWTTNTDIDGKPTYDDDGHFYIPTAKIERKFACEPAEMHYYSCIFCGKEKLVIHETSTMMDRPDYEVIKTEYADCTHVTYTYQCRICKGEFPHPTKPEDLGLKTVVELKATDGAAHYANDPAKAKWDEVIEAYVAPTCTAEGSKTWKCMNCGATKKTKVAAAGHVWGEWELITESNVDYPFPPDNSRVYLRTCQICKATESKIIPPGVPFETKQEVWVKTSEIKGDCQTPYSAVWTLYTVNGYGEFVATTTTKAYTGEYGKHIMAHKIDLDKAATCTTDGIEYYVCTVCGGYDTAKKEFYGHYETKVIPAGHKFGEWVVTTAATPTAAGEETRTCTVCGAKETRPVEKLDNPAKYEVEKLAYTNPVATGSVKLEKGTDALKNAYARVTFFVANGDCMIQIVDVDEAGNFTAGAIGNFTHVSVIIVDDADAYGAEEAIEHAHGNGGIEL